MLSCTRLSIDAAERLYRERSATYHAIYEISNASVHLLLEEYSDVMSRREENAARAAQGRRASASRGRASLCERKTAYEHRSAGYGAGAGTGAPRKAPAAERGLERDELLTDDLSERKAGSGGDPDCSAAPGSTQHSALSCRHHFALRPCSPGRGGGRGSRVGRGQQTLGKTCNTIIS